MSLANKLTILKFLRTERNGMISDSTQHKLALRTYNRSVRALGRAECRNAEEDLAQAIASEDEENSYWSGDWEYDSDQLSEGQPLTIKLSAVMGRI